MSTLLAIALTAAATATTQADCSWDRPGANPYTGTTDAAIDRYSDIPVKVRDKLKRRMSYGNPDETVQITRDAITGKYAYAPTIRDMHFGAAKVCSTVTRANWSATRVEPAAVYCADSHCILVPRICGNVSRITRQASPGAADQPPPVAAHPLPSTPLYDWGPQAGERELGLLDAPYHVPSDLGEALRQGIIVVPEDNVAWQLENPETDRLRPPPDRIPPPGGGGGGGRPGKPATPEEQPVTAVPEPETWAMLLAGFGLTGWMVRRKQRADALRKTDSADS